MASTSLELQLPSALDAERVILGAILQDADSIGMAAKLTAEDFHLDAHRRVFNAMQELATKGAAIDLITLPDFLRQSGELQSIGGIAYLATLTDGIPRKPQIGQYVRIVQDKAALRSIIRACESAISQAYEQVSVSECMTAVEEALLEIESRRAGNETYHISEFMPEAIRRLKEQAEREGLEGFTTGIPSLDNATTGIRKGELWLIGGLANSGKTPLGTQILIENAEHGVSGMMFSLEMTRFQLASRIIAEQGIVPAKKARRPKTISPAEWAQIYSAERHMSALPIAVNDASRIKLSELLMRAKIAIRTRKVELIVVDYLMLVDAPGKELRHQADAIANGLKALAKTEDVAVVLLSQFRRPANVNDRPNLTWFKESGGIENVANTALGVYCPVEEDEVTPTGLYEIVILKQREGERGALPVMLDRHSLRFFDREVTG